MNIMPLGCIKNKPITQSFKFDSFQIRRERDRVVQPDQFKKKSHKTVKKTNKYKFPRSHRNAI